ncbi:hypothetical protein EN925_08940 [Mesorhizobium sp. M7A.F.Ca.US.006.04.2.1]|uniref:histidine kinase n=2 Tax=Mesorhizobium TaxID=68287 RepID=E8TLX6_MESCW|nr:MULTISPECIES: sensor histidine kinase [Mesorhizobium]ADV10361.1 ATP-binding region ATPase domain protein [Mesorhizobium ciceri biovar biserrulae WSM1271]RUX75440.1 hypothetical protein EN990_13840 [Mesorhizobium sp. M7A.F.Ca.US.005.03.1.1]RUY16674.1 hypothetical protein EN991_10575 [Mesorhizobium sp. M7A.F.Ca.US.005.03.2.1]RUY23283.1 hypothetical protein EN979_29560 [Mesorhizobium sp. M7A.F.Ca.US.001.04.2.1]RUY44843.1 hypothetical protein EN978_05005 [Mesorhizobium sp. M7A.F.Ca.US.001.04.1.
MQQSDTIRFHLFAALSILFVCLVPQTLWALPLKPTDGLKAPVSLSGHLAIFHDPTGALTFNDIVSKRSNIQFEPIPSMLTQGYQKGAIWARFSLSASTAPRQWLLQVERPLIEHITLYVSDGAGGYSVLPPDRLNLGDGADADAYPAVFPISVPSTRTDYYIRLQSSTSITTSLNLWQSQGYEEYRRSDDWVMGMVVGAIFVMIFTNFLYAVWLRDSLYLLYIAVIIESGLISLFHMGYASEILRSLEPKTIHLIWGIIVCLYSIVLILFLSRLFDFHRQLIWAWRISQGVVLLNGIALAFAIVGRYGDVGFFVSRLQQLSLIFISLLVLYLLIVRRRYQYLLSAIAFLSVISVMLVMQMMYTGANPFQLDGSLSRFLAGGTVIHLALLSAAVAKRTRLAERSLSEEKDRVIAVSRLAEQELTIKVRERTAELGERNTSLMVEVDRRHLLELKLRQALDTANDALAQQRDFVALVSHEFRGPLAVISAAADNLSSSAGESADNIKLRTTRIRQTVKRMSSLIENVLAFDRLNGGHETLPRIKMFDLNEVLRAAEAGLDDAAAGRVSFTHGDEVIVKGDRNLLEIVIQNLIQNALKYSSVTSSVTIRLSTEQGVAFVHVADQGSGVAPDDHEFIFMRYYRAAGQLVNGSGLGLYISREIARQHGGGLILAASDVNGSTFRLSLPVERNWPAPEK